MKGWTAISLLLLAGIAPAGEDEPSFQGKTASEWAEAILEEGGRTRRIFDESEPVLWVLASAREQAQAVIAALVEDHRPEVRALVARQVLRTSTAARDLMADDYSKWATVTLLDMLEDENPEVRAGAASGFYGLKFHLSGAFVQPAVDLMATRVLHFPTSAIPRNPGPIPRAAGRKLRELLSDPSPVVRDAAGATLLQFPEEFTGDAAVLGEQDPTADLVAALTSRRQDLASRAVSHLARRSEDAEVVVPALLHAAKTRAFLRRKAILALAQFGPAAVEALPEIRRVMNKGWRGDRPIAALAVWRISGEVEGPIATLRALIERQGGSTRTWALRVAATMREEAAPLTDAILKQVRNGSDWCQHWALHALRRVSTDRAQVVAAHVAALRDQCETVKLTAAVGLGLLGDPPQEALPDLIEMIEEGDWYSRKQLAFTISRFGTRGAAAATALGELLDDHFISVRHQATLALLSIGIAGIPPLIAACSNEKAYVRGEVAGALGSVSPTTPEIQEALTALLDDPVRYVRLEAAVALVRSGGEMSGAVQVVCDALATEDLFDREWAAEALLRMGPGAVPDWVTVLASDSEKIDAAVRAILLIPVDRREFLPEALMALTGNEEQRISAAATRALALLRP